MLPTHPCSHCRVVFWDINALPGVCSNCFQPICGTCSIVNCREPLPVRPIDRLRSIVRGFRWTAHRFLLLIVLAIPAYVLFSTVSCFGVPSLVHLETAHRLYNQDFTIESPHAIRPVDRTINRAGECHLDYRLFMDAKGRRVAEMVRDRAESKRRAQESNYSRRRRGGGMMQAITIGTGLAMTERQMWHAKGIRVAYWAGHVNLDRLADTVDEHCV